MWTIRIVAMVVSALAYACGGPVASNYDYSQEPNPHQGEYVLGVADSLTINVWDRANLSTNATVRPDGIITMPLIGDLEAAGKTTAQLKAEVEKRLEAYVKLEATPITIAVTGFASYRFTVTGEVNGPGVYESAYYVTIAEAVARAGGFNRFARRDAMRLTRTDPTSGESRIIPINYKLIEDGSRPDMNLVLLAGDSLHIP